VGARSIPRPQTGTPKSPADIFLWLEYLCLNSDCRGLAGYELEQCGELLSLDFLVADDSFGGRAKALREVLRRHHSRRCEAEGSGLADAATLCLLGLTPKTAKQPRAERRRSAADVMRMPIDTFRRRYERRLLMDVAHELWRLHLVESP
jgi:hypothetical protein